MTKANNTNRYKIIVDGVSFSQKGSFEAIFAVCERLYPQGFVIVPAF